MLEKRNKRTTDNILIRSTKMPFLSISTVKFAWAKLVNSSKGRVSLIISLTIAEITSCVSSFDLTAITPIRVIIARIAICWSIICMEQRYIIRVKMFVFFLFTVNFRAKKNHQINDGFNFLKRKEV
jgi:hypothetical protein